MALLYVPAIGLSDMVVVEGTSPENLTARPGPPARHPAARAGRRLGGVRRAGDVRRARSSASRSWRKGDLITTTTSQGVASYQVIAVSDSSKPVPFSELPDQLLLVTADSRIAPAHYIEVEAKLLNVVDGQHEAAHAVPASGYLPAVGSAEIALGRDSYALISAMAWAIALAAAALAGSFLAVRWARWPAWIVTIPVLLAIVWNLYQSLSALLPNLY